MRQLTLPSLMPGKAQRDGSARTRRGTSPRAAGKNRRAPLRRRAPRWLMRLARPAVVSTVAALILLAGLVTWRSGGAEALGEALLSWSGSAGFAVKEVLVMGRVETPAEQILAALDVRKGSPLFAFSPAAARERLLSLGWVREARVERRFPNVVYVDLEERRPAAIWQDSGKFALVDETGALIGADAVSRFTSLRTIVGPDAPEEFGALFSVLGTRPEMMAHVTAAVRVGGRRWNLTLDNGMTVLLPEKGVAKAWRTLAEAVQDSALMERDVVHIDLRIPDRMVLRLTPEAAKLRGSDQGA